MARSWRVTFPRAWSLLVSWIPCLLGQSSYDFKFDNKGLGRQQPCPTPPRTTFKTPSAHKRANWTHYPGLECPIIVLAALLRLNSAVWVVGFLYKTGQWSHIHRIEFWRSSRAWFLPLRDALGPLLETFPFYSPNKDRRNRLDMPGWLSTRLKPVYLMANRGDVPIPVHSRLKKERNRDTFSRGRSLHAN